MTSWVKPGAKPQEVTLDGLVFGVRRDGNLELVELTDERGALVQLPLFRTEAQMGLFYWDVVGPGVIFAHRVEDVRQFLASLPGNVQIVIEPRRNAEGRWEYLKVLRD